VLVVGIGEHFTIPDIYMLFIINQHNNIPQIHFLGGGHLKFKPDAGKLYGQWFYVYSITTFLQET
jgi:hypothetical protein